MKGVLYMRRLLSTVLAAVLCVMNVASINAISYRDDDANNNDSYLEGDINCDGDVDIVDLVYMQQFLNGSMYADGEKAERLDLNQDYVINEYDKSRLSSIVMGVISQNTIDSVCTSNLPSQTDRQYKKYTISSASETTYTLYSLNEIPNRVIIGNDDRTPESGLAGVVKITNSNGSTGTGFVVDSHTILTAAHVIYKRSNHSFSSSVTCDIYVNNTPLAVPINVTELHVPVSFTTDGINDTASSIYDYAIITVSNDLSSFINFDLGILRNNVSNFNNDIYVTGFGGASDLNNYPISTNLQNVKSTGMGNLLPSISGVWNNCIYYDVDIVGGDSGGPVYMINDDGSKTVIGINTAQHASTPLYNLGTRITPDILHFVYNNSNLL